MDVVRNQIKNFSTKVKCPDFQENFVTNSKITYRGKGKLQQNSARNINAGSKMCPIIKETIDVVKGIDEED